MGEKIEFHFDSHLEEYSWPIEMTGVQDFLKKTNILQEEIAKYLQAINESKSKLKLNKKNQAEMRFGQTVKLLLFEVLLLFVFFVLIVQKVYFFQKISLEVIAIPFASAGLILNLVIILKKGKVNFSFRKKRSTHFPNPGFRHEIFMVLNSFNKSNTYNLEWKILERGKIIELRHLMGLIDAA